MAQNENTQPSLIRNYLLNIGRTSLQVIFPVITFPYLARVLEPTGIGQFNFARALVQYFVMFASLGIPLYATRHLAGLREDREAFSSAAVEISLIAVLALPAACALLTALALAVPQFRAVNELILILSPLILFSVLGMEWLYQAQEDYTALTVRQFVVQGACLIALFVLVRGQDDLNRYAAISTISVIGVCLWNLLTAGRYVSLRGLARPRLRHHLRPIFTIFASAVAGHVYISLDMVMLGLLADGEQVGYYTAAIKMTKMVVQLVVAAGLVLLPRNAYYIATNQLEALQENLKVAVGIAFLMGGAAAAGILVLAEPIILVFAGDAFGPSIIPCRLIAPIILLIGLSNVVAIQINMALGHEARTLMAVSLGAIINFVLNLLMIPGLGATGAAIATLAAEAGVTACAILLLAPELRGAFLTANLLRSIPAVAAMTAAVYGVTLLRLPALPTLLLAVSVGVLILFAVAMLAGEHTVRFVWAKLRGLR